MFLCLALIMGYIEAIFPIDIGVPGVKLGLANLVSLSLLYTFGFKEGFTVGLMRIFIIGFLFSNLPMIIYSLSGFVVSFVIMWIVKKSGLFKLIGVSVVGGVVHNITQLSVACILVTGFSALIYIYILIPAGVAAGALVGFLSYKINPTINFLKHKYEI